MPEWGPHTASQLDFTHIGKTIEIGELKGFIQSITHEADLIEVTTIGGPFAAVLTNFRRVQIEILNADGPSTISLGPAHKVWISR